MFSRTLCVSIFILVVSCSSVQADPISITLSPTSGSFIAVNNIGFLADTITFNLEAADFSAHFFNGETIFTTTNGSCLFPNNCTSASITYLGQQSIRVGYTATINLSTNTIEGSLRYYATGTGPINALNEMPIYVFSFTAHGIVTANTADRFRFDITQAPEPASLLLLGSALTALGLKWKSRHGNP